MRESTSVITLLTDFGLQDTYVAAMKGVITTINPNVMIVDITHAIPPQDIEGAAFQILTCYKYFPKETIHVIVVDPGVGTRRKIIAARVKDYYFIAPDNGVLSYILAREEDVTMREVRQHTYFMKPVSTTFHGRDIFAAVAAHLTKGDIFHSLGPLVNNPCKLPFTQPKIQKNRIVGRVIHIDTFGNLITNIRKEHVRGKRAKIIKIKKKRIAGISSMYAAAKKGSLLMLEGSSGFLEIAQREGSASRLLRAKRGEPVKIQL